MMIVKVDTVLSRREPPNVTERFQHLAYRSMEQSCQRTVENVSCDAGYQGYQHPIAEGFTLNGLSLILSVSLSSI